MLDSFGLRLQSHVLKEAGVQIGQLGDGSGVPPIRPNAAVFRAMNEMPARQGVHLVEKLSIVARCERILFQQFAHGRDHVRKWST